MLQTKNKTQSHNDGVVEIFEVENTATPGNMPVESLRLKETLRFKERTMGLQRYWAAMQNNIEVKRVLRCPFRPNVTTQDVAVLNDGMQYRIAMIQRPEDIYPPAMDLTLAEVVQKYEL